MFKISILNFKNYFLFIIFFDLYLLIDIYKIKLGKLLSITQLVKEFID